MDNLFVKFEFDKSRDKIVRTRNLNNLKRSFRANFNLLLKLIRLVKFRYKNVKLALSRYIGLKLNKLIRKIMTFVDFKFISDMSAHYLNQAKKFCVDSRKLNKSRNLLKVRSYFKVFDRKYSRSFKVFFNKRIRKSNYFWKLYIKGLRRYKFKNMSRFKSVKMFQAYDIKQYKKVKIRYKRLRKLKRYIRYLKKKKNFLLYEKIKTHKFRFNSYAFRKKNFRILKFINLNLSIRNKKFLNLFNICLRKMFLYNTKVFSLKYSRKFLKNVNILLKVIINSSNKFINKIGSFKYSNLSCFRLGAYYFYDMLNRVDEELKPKVVVVSKRSRIKFFKKKRIRFIKYKNYKNSYKKMIKLIFTRKKKVTSFFFRPNKHSFINRFLNKIFLKFMNKGNKNFAKKLSLYFFTFLKKKYFIKYKKQAIFNYLHMYINQILIKITPALNFMFIKRRGKFLRIPRAYPENSSNSESALSLVLIWLKKAIIKRQERTVFLKLLSEFESVRNGKSELMDVRKDYYFEIRNNARRAWKIRRGRFSKRKK